MRKYIPNTITSLNLVSGFVAVIFTFSGDIVTASWLILAAMIFDFCDGLAARMLRSYSDLGKELDSLADVVSFGVAPAMIIYRMITSAEPTAERNVIIMLIVSVMPVCAALRLAKFNIDETQATGFKGLPTPANALAVISFVLAGHYSGRLENVTYTIPVILGYTVVLSLLMVTRIPLLSLKTKSMALKGNEGRYLLFAVVAVSFGILGIAAAPLIIPLYIVVSLVSRFL